MDPSKKLSTRLRMYWQILGPGLITGASDDDPSGIATYSQAGAAFGFSTLWTALITFPLMAAVQGMCARIGIVTSHGLTGTLKRHYSKYLLYLMLAFSFPAITLNIGADIQGMGAVANLLLPGIPVNVFCVAFTAILIYCIIQFSYQKLVSILKWLCLSLFLYAIVPFLERQDWGLVFRSTFLPTVHFDKNYFSMLVGILGTTISPYLFFWQATMEAESRTRKKIIVVDRQILREMRVDVNFGMLFSNIVMFFIILTTGSVLFNAGIREIETVDQAARALEPLAGPLTYFFFAVGIIGTGFLAIPVLAGSLSYILAETFGWEQGLDKKLHEAKGFYITIIVSLVIGLSMDFIGMSPIKALIYTAIFYGLTAPVLIGLILHIGNNSQVMGEFTNSRLSNVLGAITLILMTFAAFALIYFQFS